MLYKRQTRLFSISSRMNTYRNGQKHSRTSPFSCLNFCFEFSPFLVPPPKIAKSPKKTTFPPSRKSKKIDLSPRRLFFFFFNQTLGAHMCARRKKGGILGEKSVSRCAHVHAHKFKSTGAPCFQFSTVYSRNLSLIPRCGFKNVCFIFTTN